MTKEERHKILCLFAYRYSEICKYNNFNTNSERNWKKSEELLKIDQEVNGEDFLLPMLEEETEKE